MVRKKVRWSFMVVFFIGLIANGVNASSSKVADFLKKYRKYVGQDISGDFRDINAVGGSASCLKKKHGTYVWWIIGKEKLKPGRYKIFVRAKGQGYLGFAQLNAEKEVKGVGKAKLITNKGLGVYVASLDYEVYEIGEIEYTGNYTMRISDYSSRGIYVDYIFLVPVEDVKNLNYRFPPLTFLSTGEHIWHNNPVRGKEVEDKDACKGKAWKASKGMDESGLLCDSGVFKLPWGRYEVFFRLKVGDNRIVEEVATLKLYYFKDGKFTLNTIKKVRGVDFEKPGEYQEIKINFIQRKGYQCRFSIFWHKKTDLWVDTIKIRQIGEAEESISRDSPLENVLQWYESEKDHILVISESMITPSLFYRKPLYSSKKEIFFKLGLPEANNRVRIEKVIPLKEEFKYLKKVKGIVVSKIEKKFLKSFSGKILVYGVSISGEEVPLIISFKKEKGEIIYLPFCVDKDYSLFLASLKAVMEYLKEKMLLNTCMDVNVISEQYTKRTGGEKVKEENLRKFLLPAFFFINGHPVLMGMNVSGGMLNLVTLTFGEGNTERVKGPILTHEGIIIGALDRTLFGSTHFVTLGSKTYASTNKPIPYFVSTLDGERYAYTSILHLLSGGKGEIFLLRPDFWVNENSISVYFLNLDSGKMRKVDFTLDKNIISFHVDHGNYILAYNTPEETYWPQFWKEFSQKIQKEERPDKSSPDIEQFENLINVVNVVWLKI